jgi:GNAT superfamily N-acetyltransferase
VQEPSHPIDFHREPFSSPDAAALVRAQEEEVRARGDAGDLAPPRKSAMFDPPDGVFVVMRDGERPLGCAGVCRFDSQRAELKRMFVVPAARGLGLGRLLLERMEDEARDLGYTALVLETITLMSEAIGLYRAAGYTPIEPYGPYEENPTSRCFEKAIGR